MFITAQAIAKLNLGHRNKFEIEFQKISRRSSRSLDNAEFGHFKLLFCRGRQRNVQRVITHVQNHCLIVLLINLLFSDVAVAVAVVVIIRVFKITTTATATGTSLTKGLMSRTIAVHVRYNSLYISLPSSAKQQREMTNSALSEERELRRLVC